MSRDVDRADAQAPELIFAPAIRDAVDQPAGMQASRRERREDVPAGHSGRHGGVVRRSVAQLAVLVVAPAIGRTIACQGAGMRGARADCLEVDADGGAGGVSTGREERDGGDDRDGVPAS